MFVQRVLTLLKRNDELNRLTKRGEIHLVSEAGKAGVLYIEMWGFQPGNGFAKYFGMMDGDGISSYIERRLTAKQMLPLDGHNASIKIDQLEADHLVVNTLAESLISNKLNSADGVNSRKAISDYMSAPSVSDEDVWAIMYNRPLQYLSRINEGGLSLTTNIARVASVPHVPPQTEPPKPAQDRYNDWGAF